ncbi:kinase-like protein [Zalerion maritima]|uniref:Kinase-like protein n=1 Tax=Zalerion maritima TaxID=339359 RepID=A0AAD5WU41_9PEZI|nr:kinase-like protein [Zalerion maritima]
MPHQQTPTMTAKRFTKDLNKRKSSILSLASSYNNNQPCEIFKPYDSGTFNLCYFVRFPRTNQRWVVRFLMKIPDMAYPYDKRVEGEVSTMKLVSERTTIPVPALHGYSLNDSDGRLGLSGYIIMDYAEGQPLYQVWREHCKEFSEKQISKLYEQFADVYAQLRRLEFGACGTLGFTPSGQVDVVRGPHTMGVNLDQFEGLDSFSLNPGHCEMKGKISTARDYAIFIFKVLLNSWARLSVDDENESSTKEMLYRLRQIWKFIDEEWLDAQQNEGPFVLAHRDLHSKNILVDDDLNFVAVLDWEWSHVVPIQFFTPPPWLEDSPGIWGAPAEDDVVFGNAMAEFQQVVRRIELKMYGSTLLADELSRVPGRITAYLPVCLADAESVPWWGKTLLDKDSGIQTPASLSSEEGTSAREEVNRFMAEDQRRWKVVHDRTQHRTSDQAEKARDLDAMIEVCDAIGFPLQSHE